MGGGSSWLGVNNVFRRKASEFIDDLKKAPYNFIRASNIKDSVEYAGVLTAAGMFALSIPFSIYEGYELGTYVNNLLENDNLFLRIAVDKVSMILCYGANSSLVLPTGYILGGAIGGLASLVKEGWKKIKKRRKEKKKRKKNGKSSSFIFG